VISTGLPWFREHLTHSSQQPMAILATQRLTLSWVGTTSVEQAGQAAALHTEGLVALAWPPILVLSTRA
jgi:hypothetical protein